MKNIVFVHGGDALKNEIPCSQKAEQAMRWLFEMGRERGLLLVWSSLKYFDGNKFTAYSKYDAKKDEWVKVRKPIKPHFIYDKSLFKYERIGIKERFSEIAPLVNPPQMQIIAADKMATYITFKKHMVPSHLVRTPEELQAAIKKVPTSKVVIKTPRGLCGEGVYILSKKEAKKFKINAPYLVQQFTDSKAGIPGLFKGMHDLRLVFVGNKLVQSYIRTAPKGKLKANIAQGGTRIFVPLKKVPKKVKEIAKTFQYAFGDFPNTIYSVDFMYDKGKKPYVVEINNTPTLESTPGHEKEVKKFFVKLLDHIEKFV